MNRRQALAGILGLAAAPIALAAGRQAPMTTEPELIEATYFGTIRRTGAGTWCVLNDSGHRSKGLSHVVVNAASLDVYFEIPAIQVGGNYVGPDETLMKANVRMGASVALAYARIIMCQGASAVPISPEIVTSPSANIWISGTNWINAS